jgi:putative transposase
MRMCGVELMAVMAREIIELEVAQLASGAGGAGSGEAQRAGYRDRRWDARVGEIELAIGSLRTGSYLQNFLEFRRRAEQALVSVAATTALVP